MCVMRLAFFVYLFRFVIFLPFPLALLLCLLAVCTSAIRQGSTLHRCYGRGQRGPSRTLVRTKLRRSLLNLYMPNFCHINRSNGAD